MAFARAVFSFFADAFRPPFRTAPWVVLLYVVLSVIYNSDSHFNRWSLPDTDDYMRLTQMLNWLGGQSWFNLTMPHLYPEHVTVMHWARLPDLLLAGIFLILQTINQMFEMAGTKQGMAMLSAFFAPIPLFAGLLLLVQLGARPLLGRKYAGLACFLVLMCGQTVFQFLPMRVDHHAYIILFAGTAFFCLQMMAIHLHPARMAVIAALALALGMWNGAEIMPMVIFFCAALTFLSILDRRIMGATTLFGTTFFAACLLLLFVAKAPKEYWAIQYDAFSFFYVLLAMMVAAFFLALYAAERFTKNQPLLIAFSVFTAVGFVALLLGRFPDFINGPYAQTNPLLKDIFFPNIREAIPLYRSWLDIGSDFTNSASRSLGSAVFYFATRMFVILAGTITAGVMAWRSTPGSRRQKLWALYAFFGIAFALLAMFWQVRVITYAQLFALAPLTWMLLTYLKRLPRHYSGRKLFACELLAVFGLTVFPIVVVPAILNQSRFMPDMMFFLGKGVDTPCNERMQVIGYLDDLATREKKTVTVMSTLDYTPELMFYTPHNFIAAPYHRNDRGILDMAMFFRSRGDDAAARNIAKRLDLDYVLVCKGAYFQGTLWRTPEVKSMRLNFNVVNSKADFAPYPEDLKRASLSMRLSHDKPPAWLELRDIPLETKFLLFEVKKDKLGKRK